MHEEHPTHFFFFYFSFSKRHESSLTLIKFLVSIKAKQRFIEMKQFTSLNDGIWLVCEDVILWMAGFQFQYKQTNSFKICFPWCCNFIKEEYPRVPWKLIHHEFWWFNSIYLQWLFQIWIEYLNIPIRNKSAHNQHLSQILNSLTLHM